MGKQPHRSFVENEHLLADSAYVNARWMICNYKKPRGELFHGQSLVQLGFVQTQNEIGVFIRMVEGQIFVFQLCPY